MRKEIAIKLQEKAEEVAMRFSSFDRSKNFNRETFKIKEIIPLSENTAVILFVKNTGKLAAFFFYWIASGDGYWQYFVPTDSHILGMESFRKYKDTTERYNYKSNF
jgi:hypothetical protein